MIEASKFTMLGSEEDGEYEGKIQSKPPADVDRPKSTTKLRDYVDTDSSDDEEFIKNEEIMMVSSICM